MAETKIEWCDHSINPIRARNKKTGAVGHYCEKVAQGCAACYSSAFQPRFGLPTFGAGQHRDEVEIFLDEKKLDEVRRRKKPTKYFWCDMTDIFGDWMQPEWLAKCFAAMDATPQHTHLLLTKRPENVRRMWPAVAVQSQQQADDRNERGELFRRNCWLGCSVATQADADRNIPELLKCRDLAPVLFVSAEPLIEAIDIKQPLGHAFLAQHGLTYSGKIEGMSGVCDLDWLIIGGESGPHSRPCRVAWIRSLKDQCQAAGVPVFVKQLGATCLDNQFNGYAGQFNGWPETTSSVAVTEGVKIRLRDSKGGDIDEFPLDLRVREFPATALLLGADA